ncbi:MAG: hypothetical protein KAW12_21850 [Candidatus Aminicenantes bacterium]|nr:hypothetical protein [Candidatus Aminicenantes bacterium]
MVKLQKMISKLDLQDWIFFICGISAILVSLTGFLGAWPFNSSKPDEFDKAVFGSIGMIIAALASIQFSLKRIQERLKSTKEQNYELEFPIDMDEHIQTAETIDFCGLEMFKTISKYREILEVKAKAGKRIRFLIADPNGKVIDMVKLKYPTGISPATSARILGSISIMQLIRDKAPKPKKGLVKNVEIKTLDYLFPRKEIIVNSERSNGIVYLQSYTFRMSMYKFKQCYKKGSGNFFDLYVKEFGEFWDCANTHV